MFRLANSRLLQRLVGVLGILVTALAVMIGGVWPSWFTLVALAIFPSPFLFGWYAVSPASFDKRRYLRAYLWFSGVMGLGTVGVETWWLSGGCVALGKCVS